MPCYRQAEAQIDEDGRLNLLENVLRRVAASAINAGHTVRTPVRSPLTKQMIPIRVRCDIDEPQPGSRPFPSASASPSCCVPFLITAVGIPDNRALHSALHNPRATSFFSPSTTYPAAVTKGPAKLLLFSSFTSRMMLMGCLPGKPRDWRSRFRWPRGGGSS